MSATVDKRCPIKVAVMIDDEIVAQKLDRAALEKSGLVEHLIGFHYPDEALEYLTQPGRPYIDVIFLDINMPRLNGFEFLDAAIKTLGARSGELFVVMLTSMSSPANRARAEGYGMIKAILEKPLTPDKVQQVADALTAARSRSR